MTTFSLSDVDHLAALSGLSLSESESERLRTDLDSIVAYVEMLDELDVTDVEPTYQVTGLFNVFDEDVVAESEVGRDELLALAPESVDGQIKVPKVL